MFVPLVLSRVTHCVVPVVYCASFSNNVFHMNIQNVKIMLHNYIVIDTCTLFMQSCTDLKSVLLSHFTISVHDEGNFPLINRIVFFQSSIKNNLHLSFTSNHKFTAN